MTFIGFKSKMEVKLSCDLIFWIHSLVFISQMSLSELYV